MARVPPITGKTDVAAEHHAVVDAVTTVFGGVRGPFSMLLHSPKLAERVLGLVTFFRDESIVEPGLRSVAILTAALARKAIERFLSGPPPSGIDTLDALGTLGGAAEPDPGRAAGASRPISERSDYSGMSASRVP